MHSFVARGQNHPCSHPIGPERYFLKEDPSLHRSSRHSIIELTCNPVKCPRPKWSSIRRPGRASHQVSDNDPGCGEAGLSSKHETEKNKTKQNASALRERYTHSDNHCQAGKDGRKKGEPGRFSCFGSVVKNVTFCFGTFHVKVSLYLMPSSSFFSFFSCFMTIFKFMLRKKNRKHTEKIRKEL